MAPSPRRWPLGQWLTASHLLVLGLPLLAFLGTGALTRDLIDQARISMLDQGALISLLVQEHLREQPQLVPSPALDRLTAAAAQASHAAVRILDADGVVIATSGPRLGEDLSAQPEVAQALQRAEQAWEVRAAPPPDPTRPGPAPSLLFRTRIYVANPLPLPGGAAGGGVVLLSRSPRQTFEAVGHMKTRLSAGLGLALLVTLLVSVGSSHALTRSLAALAEAAHRLAEGDLAAAGSLEAPRRSRVREVHALAEAFAQMAARLQARLTYIREFASNVSHEFKTPLSTLRGTIELLEDDAEMPPAQRARFLQNASAEVERLSALVSGLLDLARAEELTHRAPVDLDALLDDLLVQYPEVTRSGPPAPVLLGEARQWAVVLRNLLENAHQHGAPPIRVETHPDGLSIIDAGPGISPGNQARLFERFFTTDRRAGTGLGLALARTIVRAHGGDITVESAPGRTVFSVRLRPSPPLAAGAPAPPPD